MKEYSIVIQAGGKSSRMGQDKALMPFKGTTMIEYILQQVRPLGKDIVLISNRPDKYRDFGYPVFSDVYPDIGALGGLYTAIHYSPAKYCLLLACDMPFVNLSLIEHLLSLAPEFDAVIPRIHPNEFAEPFRAVYQKSCLPSIEAAIISGQRRVRSFFGDVNIRFVDEPEIKKYDPELITFFNVNTSEDMLEAEKIAQKFSQSG
jgi:molybdopterin-guanine dinucleotide biosynthesis protein A